jgi:hypothetical protein
MAPAPYVGSVDGGRYISRDFVQLCYAAKRPKLIVVGTHAIKRGGML